MVAGDMEGLPNFFTHREVAKYQASLLVGIDFQDAALANHRFDQVPLIETLFNHMPDGVKPDPISPCAHERPNFLKYALIGIHVNIA
jgi:hypothetical protein